MKSAWNSLRFALICLLVFPVAAYGYLDPGTGSMIIQVTIGAIAAALTACKIYWRKISALFKNRSENK